eukprot:scaffold25289_cov46-Attheya_sp.AAC.1
MSVLVGVGFDCGGERIGIVVNGLGCHGGMLGCGRWKVDQQSLGSEAEASSRRMGYGYRAWLADEVFLLGHLISRRGWVGRCGLGVAFGGPGVVSGDGGAMAGCVVLG